MGWDAGEIAARLVVDRSQFQRELREAKADADKWSKGKYTAKLSADGSPARKEIDATTARADRFGKSSYTAKLKVDNSEANRRIAETERKAGGIGTAFSKVPSSLALVTAALPGAISLTGGLGAAAIGVGGAFATAGLAAASFGAVAIPMFTQAEAALKKVQAAQLAYAKATTPAGRQSALAAEKAALDKLTPSELKLADALKNVKTQWKAATGAVQPQVWSALSPVFHDLDSAMLRLPSVVVPVSGAVHDLGVQLGGLINSGVTDKFTRFLGGEGSASLHAGGSFLIDTIKTIEEVLPQFSPLINDANRAIEHGGEAMAKWAGSASASNGIEHFLQWVHDNSGTITGFLKSLGAAIVNVGKASAEGGIGELKVLSFVLQQIASLPPDLLAPVVDGLTAISLLSKVSLGEKLLNGLGRIGASATGISAAGTAMKGLGAEAKTASSEVGLLTRASAALDAVSPLGWLTLAAAAAGGLYLMLRNVKSGAADLVPQLISMDHAADSNIAGYRKLADQLGPLARQQEAVAKSTGSFVAALGASHLNAIIAAISAGTTAYTAHLGSLSRAYGVSASQALKLAHGAGVSDQALSGSAKAFGEASGKIQQYVISNEHALPAQQETNALIRAMGNDALTASDQVTALDTSFRLLVGDLVSRQQALSRSRSDIAGINQAIRQQGVASHASLAQIQNWAQGLQQSADAVSGNSGALRTFLRLQGQNISHLEKMHGLSAAERADLQGARKFLDALAYSQRGLTGDQRAWISVTESQFLPDLKRIGGDSQSTRTDVEHLANSILHTGTQSSATRGARAHLISDLEGMGVKAKTARGFVKLLIGELGKIPAHERAEVSVTGSGNWHVTHGLGARGTGVTAARGAYITRGTPGVDDQLVMAQKGELVVPTPLVNAGAVDHLRGKIPGFADGGVVGSYSGTAPGAGKWALREYASTVKAIEESVAAATAAGMKAAARAAEQAGGGGVAGPGGGAPSANAALARKLYPQWGSGANWAAWNYVAMRESGWSQFAQNASSGAYGIPQSLPFTKMPKAAWPASAGGSSNPHAQITWMAGYMSGRYGGPQGAAAHERAYNRYAGGSKGAAPGWAWVGEAGPELVHMHGGERVLSHAQSVMTAAGITRGYAGGTGNPEIPHHPVIPALEKARHEERLLTKHIRELNLILRKPLSKELRHQLIEEDERDHHRRRGVRDDIRHLEREKHRLDREIRHLNHSEREQRITIRSLRDLMRHAGPGERHRLEAELDQHEARLRNLSRQEQVDRWRLHGQPKSKEPPGPGAAELGRELFRKPHKGVLNDEIAAQQSVVDRDTALLKVQGLSGHDRKILKAELEKAKKRLKFLSGEGTDLRAYRSVLRADDVVIGEEIAAAQKAGEKKAVAELQAKLARQVKTISGITEWLSGAPKKKGGSGGGDGSGGGGAGGDGGAGGSGTTPAGKFVGMMPLPPGSAGGGDFTGGGTGGLGGSGAELLGLPGMAGYPSGTSGTAGGSGPSGGPLAGTPWRIVPSGGGSAGGSGPGGGSGWGGSHFPEPVLAGAGGGNGLAPLLDRLDSLIAATRQAPGATGGHLAAALNGTARAAYSRAQWSNR